MSKGKIITANDFGVKIDFTVAFDTIESANVFIQSLKNETIIAFAMWSLKQVAYNQAERLHLNALIPDEITSNNTDSTDSQEGGSNDDSQSSGDSKTTRTRKSE